jgi:hypothetical protein
MKFPRSIGMRTLVRSLRVLKALIFLSVVTASGCAAREDFWGITYHTEREGVAVTHLLIKAHEKVLDENYQQRSDGSLSRFYREGFSGRMPHPDSLFVQWVEEDTGAVHERQISLRDLLPSNMEDQKITLIFIRSEMYVFLVHKGAVPTEGHPVRQLAAPQLFPNPRTQPYSGSERPNSWERP